MKNIIKGGLVLSMALGCLAVVSMFIGCSSTLAADLTEANAKFNENEIRLYTKPLAYEVLRAGKVLVAKTEIGMKFDGLCCAKDVAIKKVTTKKLSGSIKTPIYKKSSVSLDGIETFADFGDFGIRLVAREDGVAYRFETKKAVTVDCEKATLKLPKNATRCWFYKNTDSNFGREGQFPQVADVKDLKLLKNDYIYLPFVYSVDGAIVAVTESDVRNYPVWNFNNLQNGEDGITFSSLFEKYPKQIHDANWGLNHLADKRSRKIVITKHDEFLVKSEGARSFPWRTFILADSPSQLCENDIVYALATPICKKADFSWVKPGKVAWDWWNDFDNLGTEKGCTTAGYKRFIDFAQKNGIEYVVMDEGWSEHLNIWKFHPRVDVAEVIRYGKEKGVDIILWLAWAQAYGEEEKVAEYFAKLGAKGFKVDFMDRGDAEIAVFLEKFAKACANNKMVVFYHGTYRPSGMHRQYPNILNYEGVQGLEHLKWAKKDKKMPDNDVMCFFLRMTAGPMDYTPGAMDNYPINRYAGTNRNPGSVGTRVHQMALMALYEAPLQMLCDSPTKYEKNMECFNFMAKTPVVWDKTIGLPGCPETIAAVARLAKDGSWYVAGITNCEGREYEFTTDFLKKGTWKAEIFRDADNANEVATSYVHENKDVNAGSKMKFKLANGGGFIIHFTK